MLEDLTLRRTPIIPGIDGLRALSALVVFFRHANRSWASGGAIGVDIFFVISGFVIARSLLCEYEKTGTVEILRFYARRAVRLWPALIVMALTIWALYPTQETLTREVIPSVFYFSNWSKTFYQFPFIIGHCWTLGVEEQFYLLFPFVLLVCVRWMKQAVPGLLSIAVAVAIWRGHLYLEGYETYFRFDTRCDALLIGASLAFLNVDSLKRLSSAFIVAAVFLVACVGFGNERQEWMFLGGDTLVAVAAAVILARIAAQPSSRVVRFLETPALRDFGRISYAFYLWHFPVMHLFDGSRIKTPAAFVVSLALAIASWFIVEVPVKTSASRFWRGQERLSEYP
jgi:peptidoglycan/LPS O-acetylase OafA/YrhL